MSRLKPSAHQSVPTVIGLSPTRSCPTRRRQRHSLLCRRLAAIGRLPVSRSDSKLTRSIQPLSPTACSHTAIGGYEISVHATSMHTRWVTFSVSSFLSRISGNTAKKKKPSQEIVNSINFWYLNFHCWTIVHQDNQALNVCLPKHERTNLRYVHIFKESTTTPSPSFPTKHTYLLWHT
jgi:hypothetical protein